MSKTKEIEFDDVVKIALPDLFGKSCCRQRVGRMQSLSIGFGERIPHGKKLRLVDDFFGEWEIGTYSAEWDIVRGKISLCSSRNFVEKSLLELDETLNKISFGKIEALEFLSESHVRVRCDTDVHIDFLASNKPEDQDEFFHIFCPGNVFIACSLHKGWFIDKRK